MESCHKSALCTNVEGGYLCECPLSANGELVFTGTGYQNDPCVEINGCAEVSNQSKPCHESAVCIDKQEGFECACLNGFKGAGTPEEGCTDVNECVEGARINKDKQMFVVRHVFCTVCCVVHAASASDLHAVLYSVCVCLRS